MRGRIVLCEEARFVIGGEEEDSGRGEKGEVGRHGA